MKMSLREPCSASAARLASHHEQRAAGPGRRRRAADDHARRAASAAPTQSSSAAEAAHVVGRDGQQVGRALEPARAPRSRGAITTASRLRQRLGVAPVERRVLPRAERQVEVGQQPGGEGAAARDQQPRGRSSSAGLRGRRRRAPSATPHTAMNVWLVAPEAGTGRTASRRAPPASSSERCQRSAAAVAAGDEERVQRVHALDVGLAPEARG